MKRDRCILLAEDDENDVVFIQRAFRHAEISNPVQIVPDGQAAIEYLSGSGDFSDRGRYPMPCLLLLDLKMPRKTGLEVLEWARTQPTLRSLPIIILSSSVHSSDIEAAYQNGANAFVTKPSGAPERTELVRMIKGFWLTFNQLP
jgi:CheY-like chemotaxis protein